MYTDLDVDVTSVGTIRSVRVEFEEPEMNFTAMLEWSIQAHRDRSAVAMDDRERTYGELGVRATRLAHALRRLGVGRGDRVLLAVGNGLEYFESELAVARLGAVKVPVLTACTAEEIRGFAATVEPAAALAADRAVPSMRAGLDRAGGEVPLITIGEDDPGEHDYETLIAGAPADAIEVEHMPDDLYAIRFTGGTTGVPKGVMMDHQGMATLMSVMLLNWDIRDDDVCLHIHPTTHASGFVGYGHFLRGARNVFVPEFGITAATFFAATERYRATTVFTVPTLLNVLLDAPELPHADVSTLRQFIYGGSPIAESRLRQGLAVFGPVFTQLYGSSEAPFIATTLLRHEHVYDGDEPPRRLRSAGRPALGIELRIARQDRTTCAPEEIGEIAVRGDNVMVGFWANDELTAQRKVDGWVYTGDLGYQDADGYVYLVDRKEDMIISGGFNIWPNEVENVLCRHERVREAAVFGLKHDHWGEIVIAAVVPHDGAEVSSSEIREFAAGHLVNYKVPKHVLVRSEPLPKSGVGKVLRRHVRDEAHNDPALAAVLGTPARGA